MVEANYAIWGGASAVSVILFVGVWVARAVNRRRQRRRPFGFELEAEGASLQEQVAQHEALMKLMNQGTDCLLASLARSIELERQKLGTVVRNPSTAESGGPFTLQAEPAAEETPTAYERILPLAGDGLDAPGIARRLNLSEAEVALVMQMRAA